MGLDWSEEAKSLKSAKFQSKVTREIEQIYSMFNQSIYMEDKFSRVSYEDQIGNIDSVIQQLLQEFTQNEQYLWGHQISAQFKKHFTSKFQQIWWSDRQRFYNILVANCGANIQQLKQQPQNYFYKIICQKAVSKQSQNKKVSRKRQMGSVKGVQLVDVNIFNASILQEERNKKEKSQNKEQEIEEDYLPLYLPHIKSHQQQKSELELRRSTFTISLANARIENCSIVLPETVFLNRLSSNAKQELNNLIYFYKSFDLTLQQTIYSSSLISCPFKHFLYFLLQKTDRKKMKVKVEDKDKDKNDLSPRKELNMLYENSEGGKKIRRKRETNNIILLDQINRFCQAYSGFIWKFLQLSEVEGTEMEKLINIDTLYGIVLKSVWKSVEWIGERGSEYEEYILDQYYLKLENFYSNSKVSQMKKEELLLVLEKLKYERNPQKYLKKIVIFYSQVSKVCETADDLLNIYQELLILSAKKGTIRSFGIFRMKKIIEKVLRLDQNYSYGGEISYSWTTWCIMVELLREKINSYSYGNKLIIGENQWENVMIGSNPI